MLILLFIILVKLWIDWLRTKAYIEWHYFWMHLRGIYVLFKTSNWLSLCCIYPADSPGRWINLAVYNILTCMKIKRDIQKVKSNLKLILKSRIQYNNAMLSSSIMHGLVFWFLRINNIKSVQVVIAASQLALRGGQISQEPQYVLKREVCGWWNKERNVGRVQNHI